MEAFTYRNATRVGFWRHSWAVVAAAAVGGLSGALPELLLLYVNAVAGIHMPVGMIMLAIALQTFLQDLVVGGVLLTLLWPFSRDWGRGVLARLVVISTLGFTGLIIAGLSFVSCKIKMNVISVYWPKDWQHLVITSTICGPFVLSSAVMGGVYWLFTRGIKA